MTRSHRSSHASETCRLEWRPSRLLASLLILIGGLAALAVLASEMPRMAAWLLAPCALLHGVWLGMRELRKPRVQVTWDGHAGVVCIDGMAVADPVLHWRGPLAFLRWRGRDGRYVRLAWWPDTLPGEQRRELRLAAGQGVASRFGPSMAP